MNILSKPSTHPIPEGRVVPRRFLHTLNSTRLNISLPNTAATATPIYGASTGGATAPRFRRVIVANMASSNAESIDERIPRIASTIRVIPDFPKPGIMFQDITTLLLDPKAFKDTIDLFVERYKDQNINVIAAPRDDAGVEARGFIFGPPIALAIGAKFIPLRKPKKLPGEVISEEYTLEYGTDKMEMHVEAVQPGERAVIVDDLIATGGSLNAAIHLLERVGVDVVECACVIELEGLKGREKLGEKALFVLVNSPVDE